MELQKYLQEFDDASKKQDHIKMMAAMQEFFSKIHSADERNGTLLGLYSMAQQLEVLGMNSRVIKQAVRARVASQSAQYPSTWQGVTEALNSLLAADGLPTIIVSRK